MGRSGRVGGLCRGKKSNLWKKGWNLRCENFRALCREYGISPRVGYEWKKRLLEEGIWQLAEKSRRPQSSPKQLGEVEACRLVQLRQRHPTWGARKLQDIYQRAHGKGPSESTIKRILERCGLVKKRRKRRASLGRQLGGQQVAGACHDIWTVDFKGWWHDAEGRCEPLTVRDECSRYVLEARALADAKTESVQASFERLFELHGLPLAIRSDNGSPFANSASPLGLWSSGLPCSRLLLFSSGLESGFRVYNRTDLGNRPGLEAKKRSRQCTTQRRGSKCALLPQTPPKLSLLRRSARSSPRQSGPSPRPKLCRSSF